MIHTMALLAALTAAAPPSGKSKSKAPALLRRACKGGDLAACHRLAHRYRHGRGVPKNGKKSRQLFARACDGGLASACYNLGAVELERKNEDRAVELFDEACSGGDMQGCSNLGLMIQQGRGAAKNDPEAARLFTKACEGGSMMGCVNLGVAHRTGRGVTKDAAAAARAFEKACEGKEAPGCANLGRLLATGEGVERDVDRARELFDRACKGGVMDACRDAAVVARGESVEGKSTSIPLLAKACKRKHGPSCFELALAYMEGRGVAKNPGRARKLYRKACRADAPRACANLGSLLVNEDPKAAMKLFRRSCQLGLQETCCTYGSMLMERSRFKTAGPLLDEGCRGGHANCCDSLAPLLVSGRGVDADPDRAAKLFAKSCEGGDTRVCYNAGVAFTEAGLAPRGLTFLERACEGGIPEGCFNRAVLETAAAAPDPKVTSRWFSRGCGLDHALSCYNLGVLTEQAGDAAQAKLHFARACQGGHRPACALR